MLDKLKAPKGANKKKRRIGRGEASGWGKTAGRGHKGQNSRSGGGTRPGFEGGQMPLQRRLPKRGFTNIFKTEFSVLNVSNLSKCFTSGDTVDVESLKAKGLIKKAALPIKILGNGEIDFSLNVKVNAYSSSAKSKIEAAGGKAEVL